MLKGKLVIKVLIPPLPSPLRCIWSHSFLEYIRCLNCYLCIYTCVCIVLHLIVFSGRMHRNSPICLVALFCCICFVALFGCICLVAAGQRRPRAHAVVERSGGSLAEEPAWRMCARIQRERSCAKSFRTRALPGRRCCRVCPRSSLTSSIFLGALAFSTQITFSQFSLFWLHFFSVSVAFSRDVYSIWKLGRGEVFHKI